MFHIPVLVLILKELVLGLSLVTAGLYVCMSDCLPTCLKSTCSNFAKFFVHITSGHGSVLR